MKCKSAKFKEISRSTGFKVKARVMVLDGIARCVTRKKGPTLRLILVNEQKEKEPIEKIRLGEKGVRLVEYALSFSH